MKLTLQFRLVTTPEQSATLHETMRRFNAAANDAARVGFDAGLFSQAAIHQRCYYQLRERYGLSAQLAVRAIGKAVQAFRRDKKRCPVFRLGGAIKYDERILRFKGPSTVNLGSIRGRMDVPVLYGEYQRQRFACLKGQTDLVFKGGAFYLYCATDVPDGASVETADFLGVDLGIANLATDSDGKTYTGDAVESVRRRHVRNRRRLQKRGTRGAKKRLKALAGREARFRRHENHVISKAIVTAAQGTNRGIALEDLKGIRARITVRRKQRNRLSGWAFDQLRRFVEYKSKLAGVTVVTVNARNSSRTCSRCGHCEKANRQSQAVFRCRHCDYSTNADLNAAQNIRAWASSKHAPELAGHAA